MDRPTFALLDALKVAATARGELRLYRRGKLPGAFSQRTRVNAEAANRAVQEGLLEVTRSEVVGKVTVEWVRVTQKGLDFLLDRESPVRALEELREALAVNQHGLPSWAAQIHARFDDLAESIGAEVEAMRQRLDQMMVRVESALTKIESTQPSGPSPAAVPWAQEAITHLDRREQVGLGERCALGDLFANLKAHHADLTIKDYHAGLKRLQEGDVLKLWPSTGHGDTPSPEYALLDGAALYYYVGRSA